METEIEIGHPLLIVTVIERAKLNMKGFESNRNETANFKAKLKPQH